jgi:hypothetical protein
MCQACSLPWRLNPLPDSIEEANFFVVLIDTVRDVDADGKPKYGRQSIRRIRRVCKNPETGQPVSGLERFASNPGNLPGTIRSINLPRCMWNIGKIGHGLGKATDIWEVRDAGGTKRWVCLQSERKLDSDP